MSSFCGRVAGLREIADFNFLRMENRETTNARTTPPTIPNIMGNLLEEPLFPFGRGVWAAPFRGFAGELVLLPPFGRGVWAAPFGGFAGGLVLVLLPVEVLKKGYISYRTVQLPNNA
jgi:hypothetical protein